MGRSVHWLTWKSSVGAQTICTRHTWQDLLHPGKQLMMTHYQLALTVKCDDGAKTTASTMITMTRTTTTTPIVTVNFQFSHLMKEDNLRSLMWHNIGGWHLFFLSSLVALFLN